MSIVKVLTSGRAVSKLPLFGPVETHGQGNLEDSRLLSGSDTFYIVDLGDCLSQGYELFRGSIS